MRNPRIRFRVVCSALLLLVVAVPFATPPTTWAAPRVPPTPADAGRDEPESDCNAWQRYWSSPAECAFQDEQAQRAKLGLPPLPEPPTWDCLYPSSPVVVLGGWGEACRLWQERAEAVRQASTGSTEPPPNWPADAPLVTIAAPPAPLDDTMAPPDVPMVPTDLSRAATDCESTMIFMFSFDECARILTNDVANPDKQASNCLNEAAIVKGIPFADALRACDALLAPKEDVSAQQPLPNEPVLAGGPNDTPLQGVEPPPGVSPPALPAASTACPPTLSGVDILWASATPGDLITATFNEFGALWGDVVTSVAEWCPCDGGGKKDKDKDQDKDHKKEQEKEQEEKKREAEAQKKEDAEHKRAEEEEKKKQQQQAGVPC